MTEINLNVSNLRVSDAAVQTNRSLNIATENFQKPAYIASPSEDFTQNLATVRMAVQVGDLEKSTSEVNDAISLFEKAGSSSQKIIVALGEMRDLAIQAAEDSRSVTERAEMDQKFGALFTQIQSLATDIPSGEGLTITSKNGESADGLLSSVLPTNSSSRLLEKMDSDGIRTPFKAWDPGLAIRGNAVQQTIDPVTGLQLIAGNQFTPDGLISGGSDLPLGDPEMLDYDLSGNDDSILRGLANQSARSTETQAFGSAVLWAGNPSPGAGKSGRLNLLSRINAEYVLANIDKAVSAAVEERAKLNAHVGKLEAAGGHLANVASEKNHSAALIQDANFAAKTSESSRNQIILKEGSGLSSQGDAASQAILDFLMR